MKRIFIFGSTGDLVRRKIIPALQEVLPSDMDIVALGRKYLTTKEYSQLVCKDGVCEPEFESKLNYSQIDFEKENVCPECQMLLADENYFYISLPPALTEKTLKELTKLKSHGKEITILAEKPFGHDLASAKKLKEIVNTEFKRHFFVADHYLFKDKILKLNKTNFKKLKISSLEKLGLENRAGYYDEVGALKDMIQSHFFNILFKTLDKKEITTLKPVKFLPAQYNEYQKDLGKKSSTETFAYVSFLTNSKKEIEFVTGKAFDEKEIFIEIDGERIEIDANSNSYVELFNNLFDGNYKLFPTMDQSIIAWQEIEKIERLRSKLKYYDSNSSILELDLLIKK